MEQGHNGKYTDSIGDKGWRIFAQNRSFTQIFHAVIHHKIDEFGLGMRRWNYFQQLQIAWWIEKMRSEEMRFEII